jgi:hypothetical protein
MTRSFTRFAPFAAALVWAGTAVAASPAPQCYTSWSDAGPVVEREALAPARDVHAQAKQRRLGDLVKITLCQENGRYTYLLVLHDKPKGVIHMTIDAKRPFER